MADCSKTVDFLREWDRMCHSFDESIGCIGCPVAAAKSDLFCTDFRKKRTEDAIAIVQKWSDAHPVMTWEGKLRELLPNADIEGLMASLCPSHFFGKNAPDNCDAENPCVECWNGEYKEGPTNGD